MSLKDKWKDTGKKTGSAFAGLGKALGRTAKNIFSEDAREEQSTKDAWKGVGDGFGEMGKSLGKSTKATVNKVLEETPEEKAEREEKNDNIIDAEVEVVKEEK